MNLYRRLLAMVKPYWLKLVGAMICMVFVSLFTAGAAFLFKGIFEYGQAYLMNYVGLRIVADIREKLYNHLQTLSLSFFTRTPTGILISRITNDVNLIKGSVSNAITGLLKDAFTILGLMGVVFYRNWKLAIIAFIIFPLAIFTIIDFGKRLRKFSRKGQQA